MSIPKVIVSACFLLLMFMGAFLAIYSLLHLAGTGGAQPSQISLPWLKVELKGPAWLVLIVIGSAMLASPIIAAAFQHSANITMPPASVQHVQKINVADNAAFRVVRDIYLLDLRGSEAASWLSKVLGWLRITKKQRTRPAGLKKYMVVRKIAPAETFQLSFATTGLLDVRCVTHSAIYQNSKTIEGSTETDGWNVIANVSTVPVGSEVEIAVEATYWNAFNGAEGEDFTTHARKQQEPEDVSAFILFAQGKPMKDIFVEEYPPDGGAGNRFQGTSREWRGAEGLSYYWTTTNLRPGYYFKFSWKW